MQPLLRHRNWIVAMLAFAVPAGANELGSSGTARGLVVHGPEEVLRDFCTRDAAQRLWLTLPGGTRYELVTSTSDPAIANPGDGSFHPFSETEVRAALAAVRFPLGRVRADLFLLPYPRRAGLESAAGPGLVLLSPGVRPVPAAQQHAEVVHELGHVIQYALMPDRDQERWAAYRRLRGIEDAAVYASTSIHRDRPHEIFAEDFRALFGGPLAVSNGTIENPVLILPDRIPGLEGFMLDLAQAISSTRLAAQPNPARGPLRFSRPGAAALPLDLFDAAGRRLAALTPAAAGEWWWDGRDAAGLRVGPGVVFARVRGETGPPVRVTLLP